ncbi:hypothetical protein [Loktanella sp. Alg231-35]|uniref:hypothetical protein n=1 Tax=Loktanella sp. Alg231-35 TaxID=1922220 RepID=UPI000D55C346|nr:hypothetical protein [Loktanella sp. Alg231-35]
MTEVAEWLSKLEAFEAEVSKILGGSEEAIASRVYNAHESLRKVSELSFSQADALKQAVRCVEAGLNQAAFVLAWTALADLLLDISVQHIVSIKLVRDKWIFTDKTSLSDERGDYAIIEALKAAKVISKSDMKTLHGLLHRRNLCAHRTDVFPSPNEALGYIDETIPAIKCLVEQLPDS